MYFSNDHIKEKTKQNEIKQTTKTKPHSNTKLCKKALTIIDPTSSALRREKKIQIFQVNRKGKERREGREKREGKRRE